MSQESATETKPVVVKKTPEELAQANGLKIFNSGVASGKSQGKTESKDPRRKRLGVIVSTVAGRREKGKEVSFKSIKTSINILDDDRENSDKVKTLAIKLLMYGDQLPVPEKKKPEPKPSA